MNRRLWLFAVGLTLVLIAPMFAPYDAWRTAPNQALQPPTAAHGFGTDGLGRDMLSRLLVGGQRTLIQALAAVALAASLGVTAGALTAFGPAVLAAVARALTAALLAVPQIVWSLAILSLLGSGPIPLVVALAVPLAAPMAAISRASFKAVAASPFVTAAQSVGSSKFRIVINHILPNSRNNLARYCAVLFTYAVLNAAGLAFLGFSQPGEPEWGAMLNEARAVFRASPWPALASGLAITGLVWAALALSRGDDRITRG
jgi:peptide/nickel transport system permease protein